MSVTELGRQSLYVELPLAPLHADQDASIAPQSVTAILDLSGGPRTFESEAKTVGSYRGLPVLARLAFDYSYDREEDKLTIRGNDDRTPDQLGITTFLSGTPDLAFHQAPSLAFHHTPNDLGQNHGAVNMWADHVRRHPALADGLAQTARDCNDAIVKAAMDAGLSMVLKIGTPPLVTLDNVDDFKRMFGEPVTETAPADKTAEVIRIQFKVDSTYVGTVTWKLNTTFANVIGSTHDPQPPGVTSWLGLWADKCNGGHDTTKCSSYNFFSKDTKWVCTTTHVGGHIIPGTVAKSMAKGSTVYILPICSRHNGSDPNYMKSLYNPDGVQLKYW